MPNKTSETEGANGKPGGPTFVSINLPRDRADGKFKASGYGSVKNGDQKPGPPNGNSNPRRMLLGSYTNGNSPYNTTFNTSLATSLGSSPLFSPFSDDSDYNLGNFRKGDLNAMYDRDGKLTPYEDEADINSILWLICIGMSMTFLIFTIVTCFLLLYEVKNNLPID